MSEAFSQIRIPDGSVFTVRVSVVDEKDGFTSRLVFNHPDGKRETLADDALRRGRERTLRSPASSPRTYTGRLTISFARTSHVRIRMRVKPPSGDSREYDETVQGNSKSRVDRTAIALTMARR